MRSDQEKALDAYQVAAARAGEQAAWEGLVSRWHPRFVIHARRLTGAPDLAHDAVQEAWMDMLRGLARLDNTDAFAAWAYRIVTRRCGRLLRSKRRRRDGEGAAAQETSVATDAASEQELSSEAVAVRSAIAMLSPAQQATLALFYIEGFRVAEIAVALDVPAGTVKTRLMHGRNLLKSQLTGV